MHSLEFINFIENLAIVKDLELKSKLIKDEINKLNQLLKEEDSLKYTSRLDKIMLKTKHLEIETYKNVLSFRLSILQSGFQNN